MTKNEMQYLDSSLIGPAMLFLNQYFNFFIKEYYVLWLCFVSILLEIILLIFKNSLLSIYFPLQIWVTLDLLRYSAQVCTEICDHLNIQLFRIPYTDNHLHQNQRNSGTQANSEKNGTTITTRSQSRRLSKKH